MPDNEKQKSLEEEAEENCGRAGLRVKFLSPVEAKAMQDEARKKYEAAFEILKDK